MSGAEPLVIGIAGGIGSGKSLVARLLAEMGCLVIDSDKEAKALLRTPEVRDELASWWGPGVLDDAGEVDRSAVAKIVFENETQRRRLEGLIHPRLKRTREQARVEAREAGAPAVVLDSPLLFEAGLDAECDAVIFVDAPREQRLARVREGRGWDEAELARREKSQWSLEDKAAKSDYAVANDSDEAALRERLSGVFQQILAQRDRQG